jgi:hypothetical protein
MSNFDTLATKEIVEKTAAELKKRNIEPIIVNTKEEALAKIKELIPAGASVNNGSSKSLEAIGYVDYLKSEQHPWNNLKARYTAEKDPVKQAELRRQAILSDYMLGSVHAVTQDGQILVASNTASQLPGYVQSAKNVIWVVGTQKIVVSLDDAFRRLKEYVYPLEDQHMKSIGVSEGTFISKMLIIEREPTLTKRKVYMILVNEKLGF